MSGYWWRSFRGNDTLTRAVTNHIADTNAQFQKRQHHVSDQTWDRLCWGLVIVGFALLTFWALMHAPASLFH